MVTIGSSQFVNDDAESGGFNGASGGAMNVAPGYSYDPTYEPLAATITDSLFSGNKAEGTGDTGATGEGGAIATENRSLPWRQPPHGQRQHPGRQ